MAALKHISLLALLVVSAWAEDLSVSELLEKANRDVVRSRSEPLVLDDMAYASGAERNADPCTSRGCMWGKSSDGKVYVPYVIARQYSSRELAIIHHALDSFSYFSCIRFVSRTDQKDYLNIQSLNGCYSYVGRVGNVQTVSLSRQGCVYHGTTQHELLHALGFNHEQTRSDRDHHIRVLLQNVLPGMEHNFDKFNSLNLGIAYDYNSVMQYHRYAFSKNNQPTLVPIPDEHVEIGMATEMNQSDIARLNRLYEC